MKWLKEWIRNWLEVDKSPYFATDEEIWDSQVNLWEFIGDIDANEANKLRAETHKSDKLKERWEALGFSDPRRS